MSSASHSSKKTPERHLKSSHHRRRVCDYGDEHVERFLFEDEKNQRRGLASQLELKDQELLQYHNLVATKEEEKDALEAQLQDCRRELQKKEDEKKKADDDYDKLVEEYNEVNEIRNELVDDVEKLKEKLRDTQKERDSIRLGALKRERSPDPRTSCLEEENKRLKKEEDDVRKRLTQVISQVLTRPPETGPVFNAAKVFELALVQLAKERDEEKEKGDRLRRLNVEKAFTPDPERARELEDLLENAQRLLIEKRNEIQHWIHVFDGRVRDPTPEKGLRYLKELEEHRDLKLEAEKAENAEWERLAKRFCHDPERPLQQQLGSFILGLAARNADLERRPDKQQIEEALQPLVDLHPNLASVTPRTPRELARAITELLSWNFATLWQHLPHPDEQDLITPSGQLEGQLARLVRAAEKLRQNPEAEKAKVLRKELQESQERQREVRSLFDEAERQLRTKKKAIEGLANVIRKAVQNGD